MIAHVVPDTSVVIKWFRQGEVLADQALALRVAYVDGRLMMSVPALLVYELANVLRYKADLTTTQVGEAVQSLFDMGMMWMSPSAEVMGRAVEIAREFGITVYDAAFVAVAESLNAVMVTADERLAEGLARLSFVRCLGDLESDGSHRS
jgi:predicted nucleic acid-binding protein